MPAVLGQVVERAIHIEVHRRENRPRMLVREGMTRAGLLALVGPFVHAAERPRQSAAEFFPVPMLRGHDRCVIEIHAPRAFSLTTRARRAAIFVRASAGDTPGSWRRNPSTSALT